MAGTGNKSTQNTGTNKTDKYNPPKDYAPPLISKFINWVESMNFKYSVFEDQPVYNNSLFPWVSDIEENWEKIRNELDEVMKDREELPNFHDIIEQVNTITQDNNWKTYFLAGHGINCEENRKRCPETVKLLENIPEMKNAFFSILSPNKHIPAHKGPFNGVLRYHLGLIIPEPREQCRIRIDEEIYTWEEGKTLIFDDTYNHQVWNDTEGFRVVLFVDFLRPLKFPFNLLNKLIINVSLFTPFVKETEANFKKWENKFYKERQ